MEVDSSIVINEWRLVDIQQNLVVEQLCETDLV